MRLMVSSVPAEQVYAAGQGRAPRLSPLSWEKIFGSWRATHCRSRASLQRTTPLGARP